MDEWMEEGQRRDAKKEFVTGAYQDETAADLIHIPGTLGRCCLAVTVTTATARSKCPVMAAD